MSVPASTGDWYHQSSLDRVHRALDAADGRPRRRGTHIQASCPLHQDKKPSLSVDWKADPDKGGYTELYCHSCKAGAQDILEAAGLALSDRYDQAPRKPDAGQPGTRTRRPPSAAKPGNRLGPLPKRITPDPAVQVPDVVVPKHEVRAYDYVDEHAELLEQNVRYEWETVDGPEKTFSQRRPDGHGGWDAKSSRRKVLRHLPAVIEAIAQDLPVWLTEGEKDDEAVNRLLRTRDEIRGIATTNSSGANGFSDEHVEQLRGAHVTVVADRDPAGYRRALEVVRRLTGVAADVQVVLGAVTHAKADAHDHVHAGHGLDDFVPLSPEHARILVAAADAAALAERAELSVNRVQIAADEVQAHLTLAADAVSRKATKAAEDERRYARRWAYEAVRSTAAAADAAAELAAALPRIDRDVERHGPPPAALAVEDLQGRADDALSAAQRAAEEAWSAAGEPMPEAVREVLLRAAPTAVPAPEAEPAAPDTAQDGNVVPFPGGSGGGPGQHAGSPVEWKDYQRLPTGELIERRRDRDGRERLLGVLSLDARVLRVERLEADTDDDLVDADEPLLEPAVPDEPQVVGYVMGYTHPGTGELITLRVPADRAQKSDWLANVAETGVKYESTVRGRSKVWDAIRETSSPEVVTLFRSSGWRNLAEHGWTYVHAGGGITAAGPVPLAVRLPGVLSRIHLPTPLDDPARIRALFDRDCLALMTRLSPHVGAVLGGTAYRAVLGWTGPSTMLFGVPGSYKSAVAALTAQHFGVKWERFAPGASMSGQGSTLNAIREELWAAKDALFFLDDYSPDRGVDAAGTLLAQMARLQHGAEKRDRMDGRTGEVRYSKSSRTTVIGTSEVKAGTRSGQERLTTVDLAKGELSLDTIVELDEMASRRGRATVLASMLQWMARQDMPALQQWRKARAKQIAQRRRDAGALDRVAEPLAELEVGWELMARFLSDVGAYTAGEADDLLEQVQAALTVAGDRGEDPDSPTNTGERCRQMVVAALRSGLIHVTEPGGLAPPYPQALRYGHRRVEPVLGKSGSRGDERCEPRGTWAGVVTRTCHGLRLHAEPAILLEAILSVAKRANEPLPVTRAVVQRELAAAGILRVSMEGGKPRYQCVVPDPSGVPGAQTRMWDLSVDKVFPDADEPPAPPTPPWPDPELPPDPTGDLPQVTPDALDPDGSATMPALLDSTPKRHGDPAPCIRCGQQCSLYLDGHCVHLACYLRVDASAPAPAPSHASAPTVAAAVEDEPGQPCLGCGQPTNTRYGGQPLHRGCTVTNPEPPSETRAPEAAAAEPQTAPTPHIQQRRRHDLHPGQALHPEQPHDETWTPPTDLRFDYPSAVIDVTGTYLPDGTIAAPEPITGIAAVGAIGERLRIGHRTGPGLLVITSTVAAELGLLPDEQWLTRPRDDGEAVDPGTISSRILDFLATQTAFLSNPQGWAADRDKLQPWTRIRRGDRTFRVVLEPFVWIWDSRGEKDSGSPFFRLPDAAEDPIACWQELAHRLGRLTELLGVPWSSSPGMTGEDIAEQVQRMRAKTGGRVVSEPGRLPDGLLTGTPQLLSKLEREQLWTRQRQDIGQREVDDAQYLQLFDRRGSYLAAAGGQNFGYGTPRRLDATTALTVVAGAASGRGKLPAGLFLCTLPAHTEPGPPPHPEQRHHEPVTRWLTTPALTLLLDDEQDGGAGYRLQDLSIAEACVWPEQGRILEPFYKRLRDALLAARAEEGADGPVSRAIKNVYTGYIGRMVSEWTLRGTRPWHHQPVWQATILAAARGGLWRAIKRHQLATGRQPIAIDRDEVGYLSRNRDPQLDPPAVDDGRLGALKSSGTIALTDGLRQRLTAGTFAMTKDLPRLPAAGEDTADAADA